MIPPAEPTVLELFAHGVHIAAVFIGQTCCPFAMLMVALYQLRHP